MPQKRNRRSGVEDRWTKTVRDDQGNAKTVSSANDGKGKRWRARYVDERGREHSKGFTRKVDANRWLDGQTAAVVSGSHVAPRDAQLTVQQWCETWLAGYQVHRSTTVLAARAHVRGIVAEFGDMPLSAVRPSHVKNWMAQLQAGGASAHYVYRLHSRLSQILSDAVHDGLLGRNPCSRRTSPPTGKQKPYVATTEQVWAIYDAVPDQLRAAVLLGAFAGLRVSEVCGLRVDDIDFVRGIVHPKRQWADRPLKTSGADAAIPIPRELTLLLAASVQKYPGEMMVRCSPSTITSAMRAVRVDVADLPEGFTFHDFRHYFASLLIASGADIKTVQARLRHATATTTLNIYSHLWPDADESTRAAVGAVIAARIEATADAVRTDRQ
jgi:integrase